ncbi:MAG TPA: DUF465 domain-containing protein [Novosphingobium sp.]
MPDRIFRLMERLQTLDAFLRAAQARRRADPFEIVRLQRLKTIVKGRLGRLAAFPATG